jgi:hypothetical protein
MDMPKKSDETKARKTLVLFGLDEGRQPRGARFPSENEVLLTRMAKDFGLRFAVATTPHRISFASKLPRGDIHAADRKAVPEIAWDLYKKLNDMVGGEIGIICTSRPKHWDQIGPSHLVIAEDNPRHGWWPAFVVRRHARTLVLKWRDYPGRGKFFRDIHAVALLMPTKV